MSAPALFPGNSDARSASYRTADQKSVFKNIYYFGRPHLSEVIRLLLHTDNNVDRVAFQGGLDTIQGGSILPGEHRPQTPINGSRFVQPIAEICLSRLRGGVKSITDGDVAFS